MERLYTTKDLAGRGAGFALSDAGVEVMVVRQETLSEIRQAWELPIFDDRANSENTQLVSETTAAQPKSASDLS